MNVDKGKEAAIRGLHAYEDELLMQIKGMQENLHHVRRSIELLSGNGSVAVSPAPAKSTASSSFSTASRYADLKGQAAVELFLEENPGKWFKVSVACKELLRRGMQKRPKAFSSAIGGAFNRATEKGLAMKERRHGVFMYRSTKDLEPNSSMTK